MSVELKEVLRADHEIARLLEDRRDLERVFDTVVDNQPMMKELRTTDPRSQAKAVLKVLTAHATNRIDIFISYKSAQAAAAQELRDVLEKWGPDKLNVFVAKDSITGGKVWQEQIYDALSRAYWLIVLYPALGIDNTWVVFETGHFHGNFLPGARLLCIYPPEAKQHPFDGIARFQGYLGDVEGLFTLLTDLLKRSDPVIGMRPINSKVSDEDLRASAQKIADALRSRGLDWQLKSAYVDLQLAARDEHTKESIFASRVADAGNIVDVFNVEDASICSMKGKTLAELVARAPPFTRNYQWVTTLAEVVNGMQNAEANVPRCASFIGSSGTLYRPHVFQVGKAGNNIEMVRIVFSEALSSRPTQMKDKLLAFQTALRLSFRTRWEFIATYSRHNLNAQDVQRAEHLLLTLEAEAELDGVLSPPLLISCFEGEDADAIQMIYQSWAELRAGTTQDRPSFERAFRNKDPEMLRECIAQLLPMNTRYVEIAARRMPYMVSRYWADD
ncbi:MAG TPA: toll/interleukin-1 receptor domain-containing protein [Burkholderiales bacterium]|nr:toll/interleukin-1 receptor domain-containing protein [Burkholderiales bacterium]